MSLTFDDGSADQNAAKSILASHGMKGTFYINSGRIGSPNYLTLQQLRDLSADGNEIAGHTVQHADLTTLDPNEATREICNDRVNLANWGFQPKTFAYPYGHTNAQVEQIVANCGYNSGREIGDLQSPVDNGCPGCAVAETIPPQDPYNVRAPDSVDNPWTLAECSAARHPGRDRRRGLGAAHLPPHLRRLRTRLPVLSGQSVRTARLAAGAAPQGTVVKTVDGVIGGSFKPASPGPVPPPNSGLQNASLEADANADGVPDCWSFGSFGTNTATWSRTNDKHSGNWAENVTVSSYTSGDRKLVNSQISAPVRQP